MCKTGIFSNNVSSLSHLGNFFLFLDLFHAAVMELLKEKMCYTMLASTLFNSSFCLFRYKSCFLCKTNIDSGIMLLKHYK